MSADRVDLRTDNQVRSEMRHKNAVYARYRYSRRIHISYSPNYQNTGYGCQLIANVMGFLIGGMGEFVPNWLNEFDRDIVISKEAFNQTKDFMNMDFASSDQIASDKIKNSLKKIGTIWINKNLKIDPIYDTSFLCWAYFKHNQQRVESIPFHRVPLIS